MMFNGMIHGYAYDYDSDQEPCDNHTIISKHKWKTKKPNEPNLKEKKQSKTFEKTQKTKPQGEIRGTSTSHYTRVLLVSWCSCSSRGEMKEEEDD